jgi:hypothetical protein
VGLLDEQAGGVADGDQRLAGQISGQHAQPAPLTSFAEL